jgi:biopolymer transport protein ExbD
MILYLLKSIACLLILLLVHRLIFQREAIYKFNRFYLLAAVLGSFLIPLVEMEVPQEVTQAPVLVVGEVSQVQLDQAVNEVEFTSSIPNESIEAEKPMDWQLILWGVYGLVTIVFLIRFIRNIHLLFDKIHRNIHVQFRGETLVLLPENSLPFSFLSYIFVSGDYFQSGQLTDSVFAHEQAHVRGRHSWDNLLIEGLLVIFWFHPGLYLARQAIKLNHEFIADAAALQITPLEHYKTFLLAMMLPDQNQGLVSSLNFSLTKKRFEMMKRKTANSTKWTLILVLVPILGALVYVFSEKVAAPVETKQTGSSMIHESENSDEKETDILVRADGKLEIEGQVIEVSQLSQFIQSRTGEFDFAQVSSESGVQMGLVADVQEILRENDVLREKFQQSESQKETTSTETARERQFREAIFLIESTDMVYTQKSYGELSEKEKTGLLFTDKKVEKKTPDNHLFEQWKNEKEFALWIDGNSVSNTVLAKYQAKDFDWYFQSGVKANARTARFPQPFQVHLYSPKYFEESFGPNSEMFRPRTNRDTITVTQRNLTSMKDLSRYPDPTTAYLQKYVRYENLRTSGTLYPNRSEEQKETLDKLYQELKSLYAQSPDNRKKNLKEPILPSSDEPRNGLGNQGSEFKTNLQAVSNKSENAFVFTLVNSPALKSQTLKDYLNRYGKYQTKAFENRIFSQPSNSEIVTLRTEFMLLDDAYWRLSSEERKTVKRATFPYAEIKKDGVSIFKKFEDLTPEERNALGC